MKRLILLFLLVAFASAIAAPPTGPTVRDRPYSFGDHPGLDSVVIYVYRDTASVPFDTIIAKVFPSAGDIEIDNVYWWRIEYNAYWNGWDTAFQADEIVNFNSPTRNDAPAADTALAWVVAYIDIGTGIIDSATGQMIPETEAKLYSNLINNSNFIARTSDWAILPKEFKGTPDGNGRVNFRLPANTEIIPSGTYYELRWKAGRGGYARSGLIKRFYLDTLTDPIKILDATEVP